MSAAFYKLLLWPQTAPWVGRDVALLLPCAARDSAHIYMFQKAAQHTAAQAPAPSGTYLRRRTFLTVLTGDALATWLCVCNMDVRLDMYGYCCTGLWWSAHHKWLAVIGRPGLYVYVHTTSWICKIVPMVWISMKALTMQYSHPQLSTTFVIVLQ